VLSVCIGEGRVMERKILTRGFDCDASRDNDDNNENALACSGPGRDPERHFPARDSLGFPQLKLLPAPPPPHRPKAMYPMLDPTKEV